MKTAVLLLMFLLSFSISASVLSDAAAELQPGEWKELTNTNLPEFFFKDSASDAISNYSDDAVWYPDSQWILFSGSGHGGLANPGKFIIYKVRENVWERRATGTRGDFSHAYDFNTIDPAKGIYYHYDHANGMLLQYDIKSDTWSEVCELFPNWTPTGMVEWFPEAHKMITLSNMIPYFRYLNTDSLIWDYVGPALDQAVGYHGLGRYNHKAKMIMAGFGSLWSINGDLPGYSTYLLDSNLNVTQTAVCSLFVAHPAAVLTCDPVSGEFLVFDRHAGFYSYNPFSDAWKKMPSPAVPIFEADGSPMFTVSTPVDELGIVVFLKAIGWDYASKIYIYKHDPSLGTTLQEKVAGRKKMCREGLSSISVTPNPFNPDCRITVSLRSTEKTELGVYDANGRCVKILESGSLEQGTHSFSWNGTNAMGRPVSAGQYVCRLTVGGKFLNRKIVLAR